MKKELLVPSGSINHAYTAINNGADAIYIGGKSFGARSFATNFSNDEIKDIVIYAHLRRVKVYITVNTLISDENIKSTLDFIKILNDCNVDAIILQDIALALLVKKYFPSIELHASTQMHNIDQMSCDFLEELGFNRVVLARELTVEEINLIDTKLEIESFIHGALCISYSGQCLISALNNSIESKEKVMCRSGNLGGCAQLCRMPYTLNVDEKKLFPNPSYLLSPKDLNTIDEFNKIMKSNISSLKIEGRMKSIAYVSLVTRIYRKLIDSYYDKTKCYIEDELDKLNYLFNRGYTNGYILNDQENLMNRSRGNHKGVLIGKIVEITNKDIFIKLTKTLRIKDGIKFENSDKGLIVYNLYKNNKIIKEANCNDIVSIPNKINLKDKDNVLLTFDHLLNQELELITLKKMEIDIIVEAKIGDLLKVSFIDVLSGYKVSEYSASNVELAVNSKLTKNDILSKLSKLGNTVYKVRNFKINDIDNIFISISEINEIKRKLVEKLDNKILDSYKKKNNYITTYTNINKFYNENNSKETTISVFVKNKIQYDVVKKYNILRIYTDNEEIAKMDSDVYYEVNLIDDVQKNIIYDYKNILINNTSDLMRYKNKNKVFNYTMNLYNTHSLDFMSGKGISTFSTELSIKDLLKINKNVASKCELLIYGKPRVMMMKHCLINDKKNCNQCKLKNSNKILKDVFNKEYKVICKNGINYIYNFENINYIYSIDELKTNNIIHYRLDFLDENEDEIKKIMNLMNDKI